MNWTKCVIDCGSLGCEAGYMCPRCKATYFITYKRRLQIKRAIDYGDPPEICKNCGFHRKTK